MQENLRSFTDRGATLVAISADDVESSLELHQKLGLEFPLLSDTTSQVIDQYGLRHEGEDFAVPAVLVIGGDGRVVLRFVSESMIERAPLTSLLDALDSLQNGP